MERGRGEVKGLGRGREEGRGNWGNESGRW